MVLRRLSILFAFFICIVVPSRASELETYFDEVTGVELSIPKTLSGKATRATRGLNWKSRDGRISLDTLRFPADRSLESILEKLKSVPGRIISLERFTQAGLHLEGRDLGATRFIIHIEMLDDGSKSGASVVFSDAGSTALASTARTIARSLKFVPARRPREAATAAPQKSPASEIPYRCHLNANNAKGALSDIRIQILSPSGTSVPVGTPTKVSWQFNGRLDPTCKTPLYLVLSTSDRTRFEGEGFFAIAKGALGPFDIGIAKGKTRLFFPLHQLEKKSGEFLIKSFEIGPLALEWALVEVPRKVVEPKSRTDFALGNEVAIQGGSLPAIALYRAADPHIVVRDNFALEQPKKILRSNSNEFELHIFDRFYRALDARTGELLIEKAGIDPNFSPSGRFVGAYVEAGRDLHQFSQLARPNIEVVDLYSLHTIVGIKPIFLAWAHGDSFVLPAEVPCVRNSCSANLVAHQALVDNAQLDLSSLGFTYKSFPPDFYLSLDLEVGLAIVGGVAGRAMHEDHGWMSLLSRGMNSKSIPSQLHNATLSRLRTNSLLPEVERPRRADGTRSLEWFVQGQRVALSHHCLPAANGRCESREELNYPELRVDHQQVPTSRLGDWARESADTRLASARTAVHRSTTWPPKDRRDSSRSERVLSGLQALTGEKVALPTSTERVALTTRHEDVTKGWALRIAEFRQLVERQSRAAAALLPPANEVIRLYTETAGGCIAEQELNVPLVNEVDSVYVAKSPKFTTWMFRADCTNGASGAYWAWLLIAPRARPPALFDLSKLIRTSLDSTDASLAPYRRRMPGKTDWPGTIDGVGIALDRYLIADGTWPGGRWGLVFDLEEGAVKGFIKNVANADGFSAFAITHDGNRLIQANTDGQITFYDVASGQVVLRGVETDDELIVFDDNGYYLSTPDGAQFLHLKFPGVPGYNTADQFSPSLSRPDLIRGILNQRLRPQKPDLSAPPYLLVAPARVSGVGRRQVQLPYSVVSATGLKELLIYVDGQPTRQLALSGASAEGTLDLTVESEARWIAAVAVDAKGFRSIPRGRPLDGARPATSGRLFAISVGTGKYSDFGPLPGARRDAEQFAGLVALQGGRIYRDPPIVEPLLDAQDLRTALPAKLREIVAKATVQDTIFLFAAGHGATGPDGRFYLVASNTQRDRLNETALSWTEVASALEGARARIVVFIDACRSGAAGQSGANDEAVNALLAKRLAIAIVAASKGYQDSKETSDGGLFTTELLDAVHNRRETTDTNKNGAIELAELYAAIKPRVVVRSLGSKDGSKQTPWIARNDMVGEIPLF